MHTCVYYYSPPGSLYWFQKKDACYYLNILSLCKLLLEKMSRFTENFLEAKSSAMLMLLFYFCMEMAYYKSIFLGT